MVAWNENEQGYFTFEEVKVHPVVKKMASTFRHDYQEMASKAFYKTWIKHYNAWESAERKFQHSLDNIKEIKWDNKEQLFKVYYKKTNKFSSTWYHYTLTGEWY